MADVTFPWLLFPPAVDLSNTVIITSTGPRDLLESEEDLRAWIEAEGGRIPGVEAAAGRLADVRALRAPVYELLHACARGQQPPDGARRRLNAISASAPVWAALTSDGRAIEETAVTDPYARFEAAVARSAIKLAHQDGLSVCNAPSCGMLYLREHPRQVWCSRECGNRARVARHAARHRRAVTPRTRGA